MSASATCGRFGRRTAGGLAGLLVALVVALSPHSLSAGPALVFDVRSGEVLHAHEPFARWYPASLTKMMTAYVAYRAIRQGRVRLDTPVRVSQLALSQPPSKMGYPVGTTLSLDYALRIIIVRSANDISVAIGETVSGSLDSFIAEMNAAAARLGMADTRFTNPHGLPDARQVTTARDLALLTRALIVEFPEYQFMFAMRAIQVGARNLPNHNRLLGSIAGADGMKTGYTCSSGFNLAASATRSGRRIVAIVLGGETGAQRNQAAAGLLEAGFRKSGGFRLFNRGPRLTDLRRPAMVAEPVDLRPYVCGNRSMPAHVASFGTIGSVDVAGGVGSVAVSGAAPRMAAPEEVALPDAAPPARGAMAQTVPLPRPRPRVEAAADAQTLPVDEARAFRRRTGGISIPLPSFLRSPTQ